ncbi:hypothetical protein FOCC_FOCC015510 [Frankliniella occidentalis]|nr:hypothetical protein FOCC_FOCC015510 [Frankliniella occidentalis]
MAQPVNDFGLFCGATATNAAHLHQLMVSTPTRRSFVAGYQGMSEGLDRVTLGVDCDLVHGNILIGDAGAAQNVAYLNRLGATHVLNMAEGNGAGMVPTSALTYAGTGISYCGFPALDQPAFDIARYFGQAVTFIDSCEANGKILVHCLRGRFCSAAVFLAYLMIRRTIPAPLAMKLS